MPFRKGKVLGGTMDKHIGCSKDGVEVRQLTVAPTAAPSKPVTMNPLEAGMVFLITVEPLYAITLLELDRVEKNGDFPFAAVGRDKGGKLGLYFNSEEMRKWNRAQIGYVLAHEMLHIILMHFDRHPEHSELWNIAEDLAINDMLRDDDITKQYGERMALPGCYPGEGQFKMFPRHLDANQYYELLLKHGFKGKRKGWKIILKGTDGKDVEYTITSTQKLSKEDKAQIEQVLKEAIKKAHGRIGGKLQGLINNFLKDRTNWDRILKHVVGTIRSTNTRCIFKESRKYDGRAGSRRKRKLAVVAVRDTSASVDDEAQERFSGVLESFKNIGGTVFEIQCDVEIGKAEYLKSKWKTERPKKEITGRGGTSFIKPFQYIREKHIDCDVLIYLTDLEGEFPTGRDIFRNTIWATIKDHPIPFGKKVYIPPQS
ncbi:MAG: hypothetical protein EOM68_15210 [Spirochaetia bacterium]|nr:hypothetical protein [Spirochaetia bacterium]